MEDREQASAVAAAAQPKRAADLLMGEDGRRARGGCVMRVVWSGCACRIMLIVGLNHTLYVSPERQRGRGSAGEKVGSGAVIASRDHWIDFDGI